MQSKTPETSSADVDIVLDAFGQRLVTIFTQIAFCFPQPTNLTDEHVTQVLSRGLWRLANSFPWLAGQVVCDGESANNTGTFKIIPYQRTPVMVIRDLKNEVGLVSMEELRREDFPMTRLDEHYIAPRKSESGRPGQVIAEVFQLQVTYIRGGIILTFLGQHQAMDGTGLAQVIDLFSKACRDETYTEEELVIGNLHPEHVVPIFDASWKPGHELTHNIVKEDFSQGGPGSLPTIKPTGKAIWAHFDVSATSLDVLKGLAENTKPEDVAYISTDDALSAFIWQCVTRARLHHFDASTITKLARAVDLRRYIGIPTLHPGFVQSMTYHSFSARELANSPLGAVAAELRLAVDPDTSQLDYYCRSFATLISRTADKRRTSYLAGFDLSTDIMLNSWAKQNSYEQDFGLGVGIPEAVRRPQFEAFQGLIYLLPKSPTGDIGIAVSLSEVDMTNLRSDSQFARYARYIG